MIIILLLSVFITLWAPSRASAADVLIISSTDNPSPLSIPLWQETLTDLFSSASFTFTEEECNSKEAGESVLSLNAGKNIILCSGHGKEGSMSLGNGKHLQYDDLFRLISDTGKDYLIIIDSCHSGSAYKALSENITPGHGDITLLASCREDEKSYSTPRKDASVSLLARIFALTGETSAMLNAGSYEQHPCLWWLPEGADEVLSVKLPETLMIKDDNPKWLL